MNYQMELTKKVRESKQGRLIASRRVTLAREIELLKELSILENKKREFAVGMFFKKDMLNNLGVKGLKNILRKTVVKIEYEKVDGSLRIFDLASFSQEIRETFFEDYVNKTTKKSTKSKKVVDKNIINIIEIIKNGFITNSLNYKNINFDKIISVEITYVY